jgi:hypothetical protein
MLLLQCMSPLLAQSGHAAQRAPKTRLIIAMAIGVLISMIFLAVPSLRNGTSAWAFLELKPISYLGSALASRFLISGLSYRTTFKRELLISNFPLYLM